MANNKITINGNISTWNNSSYEFKYLLAKCDKGPVTVMVNSYGGDVNEAIAIGNMIKDRADVTVEYVAYNASAATLLGIYADKAIIRADALFMIHKTSVWIDAWGQMNEDQIDSVIDDLKSKKDLASASTLQIAKIYASKSNKSLSEILKMMKDAKWMTPEEAKENGFVDEVIPVKDKKKADPRTAAIFENNGMALPVNYIESEKEKPGKKILDLFGINKSHKTTMNSTFEFINTVLNVEGVEVKENVVTMTTEQVGAINNKLKDQKNLIDSFNTAVKGLDDLDSGIKNADNLQDKVNAVIALLKKKPAGKPSDETGDDTHPSALDYTPDPVNDYFK